jgi:hypothetical protein
MDSIGMQSLTDGLCPECIGDKYDSYKAQRRNKQVHFSDAIVTIGKLDFECDGYYQFPDELNDLYAKINGHDVYYQLDEHIQNQIKRELIRRTETIYIIRRCKQIEKLIATFKNPAKLRLERADLDGRLEKLEATG